MAGIVAGSCYNHTPSARPTHVQIGFYQGTAVAA
jgi:hypothetical protein